MRADPSGCVAALEPQADMALHGTGVVLAAPGKVPSALKNLILTAASKALWDLP